MKRNLGPHDRIARILFGLAFLAAGYNANTWIGLFGLFPMATALVGWCPLYLPFGINTCKAKEGEKAPG